MHIFQLYYNICNTYIGYHSLNHLNAKIADCILQKKLVRVYQFLFDIGVKLIGLVFKLKLKILDSLFQYWVRILDSKYIPKLSNFFYNSKKTCNSPHYIIITEIELTAGSVHWLLYLRLMTEWIGAQIKPSDSTIPQCQQN